VNQNLKNRFSQFIELVEKWILGKFTGQLILEVNFRDGGIVNCYIHTKNRMKDG